MKRPRRDAGVDADEGVHHAVRGPELLRGVAVGDAHHFHAGAEGGGDARHRVLEGDAVAGGEVGRQHRQAARGLEVRRGVRLRPLRVLGAHDGEERVAQADAAQDRVDLAVAGAGGDRERHLVLERPDEIARPVEDRDLGDQAGEDLDLARLDPLPARAVGVLAVALEGEADRLPVVVGEVDLQVLLLGDLHPLRPERVAERAEVQRLAVHDHPVEVEDRRAEGHGYFFRMEATRASSSAWAAARVAAGPVSLKKTFPCGASTIAPRSR